MRQQEKLGGFQGRCNKVCDSCYSFWNTAIIQIQLGKDLCLIEGKRNTEYLDSCKSLGGYMKFEWLKDRPDIHHTFYSLASLSLSDPESELEQFEPLLAIDMVSYRSLFNSD